MAATRARRWPSSPSSAAATGSSSATATSACTSCAASACARASRSRPSPPISRAASAWARASCPRATTACARASSRRPASSPSRSGSSGTARPTPCAPCASRACRARARRPACSRPSRAPIASCSRPPTRSSRSIRSWRSTGVREAVAARRERVVAITPMIGGAAVKGPLAGMLETLGHDVSAVGVAQVLAPLAARLRARQRRPGSARAEIAALGLRVACVADAHARRRERRRRGARRARPAVSDVSVTALRGLPELAPGDDLGGPADRGRCPLRRRPARRRRRVRGAEGGLEGRGPQRAARERPAVGARAWRSPPTRAIRA